MPTLVGTGPTARDDGSVPTKVGTCRAIAGPAITPHRAKNLTGGIVSIHSGYKL